MELGNERFRVEPHDKGSAAHPKFTSDGDPIFEIPPIGFSDSYPDGLVEAYKERYRYQLRQYMLLEHLWTVQFRNTEHRHYWNIKAAHDFWREHGPKTVDNRHYAWTITWITDAMDRTRADLDRMLKVGHALIEREAMRERFLHKALLKKQLDIQISRSLLDTGAIDKDGTPDRDNPGPPKPPITGNAFRDRLSNRQDEDQPLSIKPADSDIRGTNLVFDNEELFGRVTQLYGASSESGNRHPVIRRSSSSYDDNDSEEPGSPRVAHREGSPCSNAAARALVDALNASLFKN